MATSNQPVVIRLMGPAHSRQGPTASVPAELPACCLFGFLPDRLGDPATEPVPTPQPSGTGRNAFTDSRV